LTQAFDRIPIIKITILAAEKRVNKRIFKPLLIATHTMAKGKITKSTPNINTANPSSVIPRAKASDGSNKQAQKIIILRQTHWLFVIMQCLLTRLWNLLIAGYSLNHGQYSTRLSLHYQAYTAGYALNYALRLRHGKAISQLHCAAFASLHFP
jgi:hypothetical protein